MTVQCNKNRVSLAYHDSVVAAAVPSQHQEHYCHSSVLLRCGAVMGRTSNLSKVAYYHNSFRKRTGLVCVVDSAPSIGVYYFLSLTLSVCLPVCMSRCSFKLRLLFCFLMESSHFLAASSPCGTLQNCFLRFLI